MKAVEVRRVSDGPDGPWRFFASQTAAASTCSLNRGDLSAHLNGWSGKAPINGRFARHFGEGGRGCADGEGGGVVGVKRPRDGEGESDGGSRTPQDDDIEVADEKEEEEEEEGKPNMRGSLGVQDDDSDARPTGRLDPAALDGRTVAELKEMCRQVSNDVSHKDRVS